LRKNKKQQSRERQSNQILKELWINANHESALSLSMLSGQVEFGMPIKQIVGLPEELGEIEKRLSMLECKIFCKAYR
jgi:hypothetical protein